MKHRIVIDAEAGQVSVELKRRGINPQTRVHIQAKAIDSVESPMAAIVAVGNSFDWLADEPDLYSDADLVECAG